MLANYSSSRARPIPLCNSYTLKTLAACGAIAVAASFSVAAQAAADHANMPGMTMVFQVKEAAMLDAAQVGSKVRFTAAKVDGAIVVTALELAK